jgi:hypothetical protein
MPVIISGLVHPLVSKSHRCCRNEWPIIRTIVFDLIVSIVTEQTLSNFGFCPGDPSRPCQFPPREIAPTSQLDRQNLNFPQMLFVWRSMLNCKIRIAFRERIIWQSEHLRLAPFRNARRMKIHRHDLMDIRNSSVAFTFYRVSMVNSGRDPSKNSLDFRLRAKLVKFVMKWSLIWA